MVTLRGWRPALLVGTALTLPLEARTQGTAPLPQGGRVHAGHHRA